MDRHRTAEDSLENTLSCVPKVQGRIAESLRQTDGDNINAIFALVYRAGAVLLWTAVFFMFYLVENKKGE